MRRRDFITLLGGAVAAWPLSPSAQERVRRIGRLMGIANNSMGQARAKVFQQELERLGWVEGRTITMEYRWAEGQFQRLPAMAAELVRLDVDVIVTEGTPPTVAAKEATSIIPIVFLNTADPVATGFVNSLARPGGNLTGLSNQNGDTAGKRVELLREIVPGLVRLAILANVENAGSVLDMQNAETAARALGLDVVRLGIRRAEDIAPAFDSFKGPASAVLVSGDGLTNANRLRINTLSLGARLPAMYPGPEQIESGGLISYGTDTLYQHRRAADYVDRILRGAKPADLPVEQPTKFELIINLITAKALGLTVPPTLLAFADEVIE
jgi:putative ABC transport system substrate-binding protein